MGIFDQNPVQAWRENQIKRLFWFALGIVASPLLGIGVGSGISLISPVFGWIVGTGVTLYSLTKSFQWVQHVGNIAPTESGLYQVAQWRAFRSYLNTVPLSDVPYGKYLPYGVASGVGNRWLRDAEPGQVSSLDWFQIDVVSGQRLGYSVIR